MTITKSKSESPDLEGKIQLERLAYHLKQIEGMFPHLSELAEGSEQMRNEIQNAITQYAMSIKTSKLDPDSLEGFFKKPYCIIPSKRENEWFLAVPKFIDVQIGWLHQSTDSFNIFLVNRYVDWLGELPKALKDELGFKDPLNIALQGDYLVGKDIAKAREKYKHFIKRREGDKLLVDKRKHFEMLASLIKDGILPFTPAPITKDYIVERKCDFELRDYQLEAWKTFLKYGNIGVFFPASTGKTFLALWMMTHIKPPHLVAVPTVLLVEQWKERIELYTDLRADEVVVTTYQSAIKKYSSREWTTLTIDECHHLPANEFSKMSFIKRKFTLGLSASPQREDHREEYIFALTGAPVGLSWEHFKKLGIIQNPPCHVWIVKNFTAKLEQLATLLKEDKQTLIFCDGIELGKTISARYKIPHVYGATKQRLDTIKHSRVVVVSRVGDEGVSLAEIERVIEVDYLFGSRRQELQRFTRLLHGQSKTEKEHHIIMTAEDYVNDHKRLFSVMDKGFKIVIHREGVSEKTIERQMREERPILSRHSYSSTKSIKMDTLEKIPQSVAPVLQYPGIQKTLSKLTTLQRDLVTIMLQNDGRWYSAKELQMMSGRSLKTIQNTANFSKLKEMGIIEIKADKYRTNFTNMAILGEAKQ